MARYVPEPVPTGDDREANITFLTAELHRISEAINVKVDRAYGGLFQSGDPITIPLPDTNPVLFDAFTDEIPERPDGVIANAAAGSLAVLTGGSYLLNFTSTVVNILPNAEWDFLLLKNGVATALGGSVEPSNQTEVVTVSFNILVNANRGDVYTITVASPTSNDLTVNGSEFIATRVSESTD